MPPKKKTGANGDGAEGVEGGAFRWTPENERKLLILTLNRPHISTQDYAKLVGVFPGTNFNGVKIKISRFRVEQRNLYESLGWDLPEGAATRKKDTPNKDTTKKRTAPATNEGEEESTPVKKKPRAKKAEKKDEVQEEAVVEDAPEVEGEVDDGGGKQGGDEGVGVRRIKEEDVEV